MTGHYNLHATIISYHISNITTKNLLTPVEGPASESRGGGAYFLQVSFNEGIFLVKVYFLDKISHLSYQYPLIYSIRRVLI